MKTYAPVTEEVIEALKGVVGAEYVMTDAETLEHYQTDEETDPRKFHKPEVVVKPASAQEMAEIMKLANKFDVPVTVRSAGTSLADGAIPVCGGIVLPKGELICPGCVKKLSFVKQPVCKKCGKEITSAEREYCLDCTKHKRSFDYGRALLNYNDTAKKSMADIKYRNRREYLDFYAEAVCLRYGKLLMRLGADALVPVPVHPSRRRQRGFNQAEIFADRIGERLGIPVCPEMLVRRKKTAPQKQLNPKERLHNLEEAFAAGAVPEGGTRVILVDDIYTTGSTMEACARALLRAGVKNVYFIAICIGRGQ